MTEITTNVDRAASVLKDGGLVAFATETVYGLGANALDASAVAKIFEAKERPHFDPLIVHIADLDWLDRVVSQIPQQARPLIEEFWPGPLTLVMPKTEQVPGLVTSGLDTVAVRFPEHALARELILKAEIPIAAPSANRFGQLSPTTADHVARQLGERIELILDGGPCRVGVESTVLQVTDSGSAMLLRHGGVSQEAIEDVIGKVENAKVSDRPEAVASPGMLPRHYSPRTKLINLGAVESNDWDVGRVGHLCFKGASIEADEVEVLSADGDLVEAAANLFAALWRLDAAGVDIIVAEQFPNKGLGRAINDRLARAAN